MVRRRIELPTPSDLAPASITWARQMLGEPARGLLVDPSADAEAIAQSTGLAVSVRSDFGDSEWSLYGDTREVHSEAV